MEVLSSGGDGESECKSILHGLGPVQLQLLRWTVWWHYSIGGVLVCSHLYNRTWLAKQLNYISAQEHKLVRFHLGCDFCMPVTWKLDKRSFAVQVQLQLPPPPPSAPPCTPPPQPPQTVEGLHTSLVVAVVCYEDLTQWKFTCALFAGNVQL